MIIIETKNLTKYYGKYRGVIDLNLEIYEGEIFGYLGPNGAGKTTTIRLLLDLIKPTRGKAFIFGKDVNKEKNIRAKIGYLPGELSLYDNLTGKEFLIYMGNLRKKIDFKFMEELSERFNCDLLRPIGTLSHGNKQKIGLLQAFIHRPSLYILDEPTLGLDPLIKMEFYKLISELRRDGNTFFLSSHILPEVERICDRVGIIKEGKIVAIEKIENLKKKALRRVEIHFSEKVPIESFSNLPGIKELTQEDNIIKFTVIGSLDPVIKRSSQFEVINIISHEPSLEEIFMSFYGKSKNGA
ncbi:MAG: ABC transporter ATP-binding protein [Dictyoglomaceae bacterium]